MRSIQASMKTQWCHIRPKPEAEFLEFWRHKDLAGGQLFSVYTQALLHPTAGATRLKALEDWFHWPWTEYTAFPNSWTETSTALDSSSCSHCSLWKPIKGRFQFTAIYYYCCGHFFSTTTNRFESTKVITEIWKQSHDVTKKKLNKARGINSQMVHKPPS